VDLILIIVELNRCAVGRRYVVTYCLSLFALPLPPVGTSQLV
jgi:hypothetical protein